MMFFDALFLAAAETAAHAGEDHGPKLLGLDAEGWVYVGISIFILVAVFYAKAHRTILNGLDARIADTKKELDDAAAIRAEAEALLADVKQQSRDAKRRAEAMLSVAESEASAVLTKAESDAEDLIARRTRMAEDAIAAAQRQAETDIRVSAANTATLLATAYLSSHHDAKADATLVDDAISRLN